MAKVFASFGPPKKTAKEIPYRFVLDELADQALDSKAFFGARGYYRDGMILFILRRKEDPKDDGIWIATEYPHHESLKEIFPSMRSIQVFGGKTSWQVLPESEEGFEQEAFAFCELIRAGDPRIGKTPKPRKKRLTPKTETKKKSTTGKTVAKSKPTPARKKSTRR
jgi:hypothetical protein